VRRHAKVLFAVTAFFLLCGSSQAFAAKGLVATLGGVGSGTTGGAFNTPSGVAVNKTGNGGVPAGTFYVADRNNRRIQRLNPKGEFVSAWGFDVAQPAASPASSAVFEICTVASECRAAVAGNGTSTGIGAGQFSGTTTGGLQSIAVDQVTGNVFAADQTNRRISVFSPTGTFEGGFGWGALDGTAALQLCTSVSGCSAPAAAGAAAGQLGASIGGLALDSSGNLYVADKTNRRVDVYKPILSSKTKFVTGIEFLRAFGWGVDTNAAAFEVCTVASTCNAGIAGTGNGQFGTESPLDVALDGSNNVFALDGPNKRVEKFSSAPAPLEEAFGAAAISAAFGTGALYNLSYETVANHLYVSGSVDKATIADTGASTGTLTVKATAGNYKLTFESQTTANIAFNATAATVQSALESLSTIGAGNVTVSGGPGDGGGTTPYTITFTNALAGRAISEITSNTTGLTAGLTRVEEMDATGAHFDTHGTDLTATSANGLAAASPSSGGAIFLSSISGGHFLYVLNEATVPTMEPVTTHTGTTATFSGVVVSNGAPVTYHFEYSTDGETWTNFPLADASAGTAATTIPVSQAITGLSGSQLYHVRLRASRQTPAGTYTSSEVTFTTDPAAPGVSGTSATEILDTSATLQGAVNPENEETTYRFEYVDQEEFEANGYTNATKVPLSDASVGSGNAPVAVSQAIAGLQPKTKYHFRIVATNLTGTTEGEDRTLQTFGNLGVSQSCPNQAIRLAQHTTYLPDCRAIELVNNPDKGNQNALSSLVASGVEPSMDADGDSVLWNVLGSGPGGLAPSHNFFLAERDTEGWHSRGLAPPPAEQVGEGNYTYALEKATPDFRHFLSSVGPASAVGSSPFNIVGLDGEAHQDLLGVYPNVNLVSGPYPRAFYGEVSDDGAHALILNPETKQLEDLGGETPELISVMPGGGPSECGLSVDTGAVGESFAGRSASSQAAGVHWRPGYRMMDVEDASRVYFEARANGNCGGPLGLYERKRETEETVLIDPGVGSITTSSEFIRATPDGRHAYFVTVSSLDPADANSTRDVYRWDEEAGESVCLTCVVPEAAVRVLGGNGEVVMVSDDFSHIYFKSENELVPGKGALGARNTYVLSDGTIRYVGGKAVVFREETQLSTDGNELLFRSSFFGGAQELTSDQLAETCKAAPNSGLVAGPCQEFYVYDDQDGSFECLSCRPGGTTIWHAGSPFAGSLDSDFRFSADGSTAAFITLEPLVPQDVNNAADVYEWRQGEIHLITDGVTPFPEGLAASQVRGVSADGSSILFIAEAPGLTGFEADGEPNLYEARIDGGFEVPPPTPHCSEESCQGPLQAAPGQPAAASAGFSGAGNLEEAPARPRCRKGKVRRHGRCVARHHRKRHHARASHTDQGRTK
jgi:hypothetical protein